MFVQDVAAIWCGQLNCLATRNHTMSLRCVFVREKIRERERGKEREREWVCVRERQRERKGEREREGQIAKGMNSMLDEERGSDSKRDE